jgi:hypothetical protein
MTITNRQRPQQPKTTTLFSYAEPNSLQLQVLSFQAQGTNIRFQDITSGAIVPAATRPLAGSRRLDQVCSSLLSPASLHNKAPVMIDHFPFCKEIVETVSIYIVSYWSLSC